MGWMTEANGGGTGSARKRCRRGKMRVSLGKDIVGRNMDDAGVIQALASEVPSAQLYALMERVGASFREPTSGGSYRWPGAPPKRTFKRPVVEVESKLAPPYDGLRSAPDDDEQPQYLKPTEAKPLRRRRSTQPQPKPPPPVKKKKMPLLTSYQKELERAKRHAFVRAIRVNTRLEMARRELPYLVPKAVKRGTGHLRSRLTRASKAVQRGAKAEAWYVWKHYIASERNAEKERAATKVQALTRRYFSTLEVQKRRKSAAKKAQKLQSIRRKVMETTERAARRLVSAMASFVFLRRLKKILILNNAAVKMQSKYRRKKASIRCFYELARFHRRMSGAVVIQRWGRGRITRKFVARMRRRRHHVQRDSRFRTMESSLACNFEHVGAAIHLQRWWRRRDFLVEARRNRAAYVVTRKLHRIHQRHCLRRNMKLRVRTARRTAIADQRRQRKAVRVIARHIRNYLDRTKARSVADDAVKFLQLLEERQFKDQKTSEFRRKMTKLTKDRPMTARKMKRGVVRVQRAFKKRYIKKLAVRREFQRTAQINLFLQVWLGYRIKRIRRKRAGTVIATKLRGPWLRYLGKHAAATRIAAIRRAIVSRRTYLENRRLMTKIALRLGPLVRRCLAERVVDALRSQRRVMAEFTLAGRQKFLSTRQRALHSQIFTQSAVRNPTHASELQRIFTHYAGFGQRKDQPTTRLGVSNFTRFVKDLPGLNVVAFAEVKKQHVLTASDVELVFMKCRRKLSDGAVESHLHYGEFVAAVRALADLVHQKDDEFIRFVLDFVLKSKAGETVMKELKRKTYEGRTDTRLGDAARVIANGWRGHEASLLTSQRRLAVRAVYEDLRRRNAARVGQRYIRGLLDRRRCGLLAREVYEKLIDDEHGRAFWFNPRTNAAVWTKPKILAWFDVPHPVAMPEPDRLFERRCDRCATRVISNFCVQCDALFCETCSLWDDDGGGGKRRPQQGRRRYHHQGNHHESFRVETCTQCRFQVGTKMCPECQDAFCDTCFFDVHAKGANLRQHGYDWLVPHCDECKEFAARKIVGRSKRHLCNRCAAKKVDSLERLPDVPYVPRAVRLYKAKVEEQRRRAEIERRNRQRAAMMRDEDRDRALRKIQRVARGFYIRCTTAEFVEERRNWFRHRSLDDKIRRRPLYKLRDLVGAAPPLRSDTPHEVVLKSVPFWNRPCVTDVVDGQWIEFAKYVREHRAFLRKRRLQKIPYRTGLLKLLFQEARIQLHCFQALAETRRAKQKFEVAQRKYRNARSANEKKETLDARRRAMRQKRQIHEAKETKLGVVRQELSALRGNRNDLLGPRKLHFAVKHAQQHGTLVAGLTASVQHKADCLVTRDRRTLVPGDRILLLEGRYGRYRVVDRSATLVGKLRTQIRRFKDQFTLDLEEDDERRKPQQAVPPPNVELNKMWTGPDVVEAPVFRLPRMSPVDRLLARCREELVASPFVQIPLKIELIHRCILRRQLLALAARVDPGSDMETYLRRSAEAADHRRELRARYLVRDFDAEYGFGLRAKCLRARDLAKLAVTVPVAKSVTAYRTRQARLKALRDPHRPWDASRKKVSLYVEVSSGDRAYDRIGSVSIDLRCPLNLAREFLRRSLWRELNERTGATYDFLFDHDKPVDLKDEPGTDMAAVVVQRPSSQVPGEFDDCVLLAPCATGNDHHDLLPYEGPAVGNLPPLPDDDDLWSEGGSDDDGDDIF